MKNIIAALMAISFIGMVHADAPVKQVRFPDIPIVAKCMALHRHASISLNSADPRDQAEYDKFVNENFTDEQNASRIALIDEWNKDPVIHSTYKSLHSPDIHGWSLAPASIMAACIKSSEDK